MLEIFIGFCEETGHIFVKEDGNKNFLVILKDILYLSAQSKDIKAFNIPWCNYFSCAS